MLRRYRHIIWDWNGTLLDDLELCVEIMDGMLRQRRMPSLDRTRYQAMFNFPVRNYYAQLGFDTSDASFHELSVEFIGEYDRRRFETRLHDGAAALLDAIIAAGRTQSILSAYSQPTLSEIVDHFGLRSRFIRLSGLDHIYATSKTALGRACLADLAVSPREVLMIGDTLHDFEVARELGVDCVLVAHGHHSFERLAGTGAPVFSDLSALESALGLGQPRTPSRLKETVEPDLTADGRR